MAWFKVDDGMYSHEKVLSLPRSVRAEALGTWVLCGTWSADKLTDGRVPEQMLEELGGTAAGAEALVTVRLWRKVKGAYQFVNWEEFQPTRADIEAGRESEKRRKADYRARRHPVPPASADVPTGHAVPGTDGDAVSKHPVPDPTRPVPDPNTTATAVVPPRKRATRLPEPFIVDTEMRRWAAGEVPGLDVDRSTRAFVDYWRAKAGQGGTKVDWTATWRNWLRTDHDRTSTAPAGRGASARPSKDDRALETLRMGAEVQAALEARNQPSDTTFALREIPA